ncbi:hypothetical protein AUK40_03470 [Candidatus Wirthbacteria bacterium CG2_30_54_11]|uniref:Peptidase M50 domain-containing protein n=1 Tax=Candidatus Wirthbacteria bacterium CG2_30_54_11 TaxID=1817892 RepID=A0A1J5IJT6_9BACT|nr:MAG: hypothetical protein AUK40_03470 [Candidatus Wirthbacteria bacterium CG2_30_54_11]
MLLDLFRGNVDLMTFFFGLVAIIIAVTLHEFSHALVATLLGDPTPKMRHRLTLDPSSHLDPMGFFMLLLVGFGWGKPVPINPVQIRRGRFGVALVSLAGPVSNMLIATAFGLAVRFDLIPYSQQIFALVLALISINLGLAVFNLLPFGPLDGYKIALGLLPARWAYKLARTQSAANGLMWLLIASLFLFDPVYRMVQQWFFRVVVGV